MTFGRAPGLILFTDGACSGNPGPGGWGAILLYPDARVRELGGGEPRTTNNRMEMTAAIEALSAAKSRRGPLRLYTDSTYVIQGACSWLSAWKRRGWKTAGGGMVQNRDLWERLDAALAGLDSGVLSWEHVRGHTGSPGNERADEIAVSFAQGRPIPLYEGPLDGHPRELSRLPEPAPVPQAPAARTGADSREGRSRGWRGRKQGGYYLSLVDGRLGRHAAWAECQARVHGRSGARFKKIASAQEEAECLRRWGLAA